MGARATVTDWDFVLGTSGTDGYYDSRRACLKDDWIP